MIILQVFYNMMIFLSQQLSGRAPPEYSQVGRKHDSYHPAKPGLLNGTPEKSSGQQIKLPTSDVICAPPGNTRRCTCT